MAAAAGKVNGLPKPDRRLTDAFLAAGPVGQEGIAEDWRDGLGVVQLM